MSAVRCRYFAYGSNLCVVQMARRCPQAMAGEVVPLAGWRFAINRRGVATLLRDDAATAYGLIWHLTDACERALDRYEGVGKNVYRKDTIEAGGAPAQVYLATEERPGQPRPGYLEGILTATERLGLPELCREDLTAWARPVMPWLVEEVLSDYALDLHGIHGLAHWLRVRENGLTLAAMTPSADAAVVELFALLHDCRRWDDGYDTGHGERAAAHVRQLAADGVLRLDPARLDLLAKACAGHEHGGTSEDPTIGCCWDADRLELSRLWRRPIARFLSTKAALDADVQRTAWRRGTAMELPAGPAEAWGLTQVLAPERQARRVRRRPQFRRVAGR